MEKGAVRETEGGSEKERERGKCTRSSDGERKKRGEPREASGRLNNIIGGVLTVPGRPRANSSPLPPAWSLSLVLFSPPALFFSLAASYSPARKLRPRWALTEGPTEESFSPSRAGERRRGLDRAMPDADEDARRVRGHLALADRHRGRFLLPFPSPLLPPCSFFLFGYVSTSRRARASARSFLPHVRLLLPFRMPPMPSRESDFSPSSPPASAVFLSSPLSSLREESTSAKVDRLYPVNQVAS